MRKETVEVKTRKQAEKLMPWAAKVVRVQGGYMGFESVEDHRVWKNQK